MHLTSWRRDGTKWASLERRTMALSAGYNSVIFDAPMLIGHGQMWSISQIGTGLYFGSGTSYPVQGNGEGWFRHSAGDFTRIPNNLRTDGTRIDADLRSGTGLWRIRGGRFSGMGGGQKGFTTGDDLFLFDFPLTGAMNYLPSSALSTDPVTYGCDCLFAACGHTSAATASRSCSAG